MSRANSPWQVIAVFGLLGMTGLAAPQNMMTSVPVAKWFERKRGLALALAVSGLGIGGVFFLPFTQWLLDSVGWRTTWVIMAVMFMAMAIPLSAIFLRRQPEDMGLEVDGRRPVSIWRGVLVRQVPDYLKRSRGRSGKHSGPPPCGNCSRPSPLLV